MPTLAYILHAWAPLIAVACAIGLFHLGRFVERRTRTEELPGEPAPVTINDVRETTPPRRERVYTVRPRCVFCNTAILVESRPCPECARRVQREMVN